MADKDMTNQQLFEALKAECATKDDLKAFPTKADLDERLKNFATKEDLTAFATKDDLKSFATKEDLKAFATKADLDQAVVRLERKMEGYHKVNRAHHLAVRADVGQLNKEVGMIREGLASAAGLR
jgi:hypothetical protein